MVLKAFIIGLITIVGTIILFDIVPILRAWISRVYIGRYTDIDIWSKSVTNKGVNWLNNTPMIKVTDNTRLVVLDILKGNYSSSTIQHWQEASLILGLSEFLKYKDDNEVKKEIIKYINIKFNENGQWKEKPNNVDGAILAFALMKLDFIDQDKYKEALNYTWELIKEHIGIDGTVGYRKSMESYRYVDTVGFICPFLVLYGKKFNKDECIELAVKQIKEFEKYGMIDKHYIPSHAYEIEHKVPLGLYGWGRGLGWFAIGLIDTWNELPSNNKNKYILEDSVKRFARAAMSFQQRNGSWNWTVTRRESRPDSSTTATLGWFMLNASKIEDISNECIDSTNKAIEYLMKVTRRNGAVDFSQGDTKDIGVYSMLFNILPFTQGFCIRLINAYTNSKVV
ncbi:glycoside hydrolase family 88 protein [Cytobacillus sp. S13-E01]|uniref:glycoside hydrolase family 88 protein n=1 Tax=Cytobacillus sp. S13-E01 TaxID=3031326 RepID=UPI0023D7E6F3|nr:glycoside hydrolase family 88 protein [Cytobacillus sp. S13-E01]MDF0727758.1 glycoside hydrolase family 88 protein [Cytobacillus sp. S13-E01]